MLGFLKKRKDTPQNTLAKLLPNYELPYFPMTVMQALQLLRDPDSAIKDVAAILETDPGLHVQVLRTVNSAAYGLAHRISNIHHAVTLLGRSRLESLIVAVAVKDRLPRSEHAGFEQQFWLCASRRACLGRALAEVLHPTTQAESFAAGLLQDIAVPVLFVHQGGAYRTVYQRWLDSPDAELPALERDELGYDHPEIGALIAESWNLGDYLVTAIAGHHQPDVDEHVDAAITLAAQLRPDAAADGSLAVIERAHGQYHLGRDQLQGMLDASAEHAADYAETLTGRGGS